MRTYQHIRTAKTVPLFFLKKNLYKSQMHPQQASITRQLIVGHIFRSERHQHFALCITNGTVGVSTWRQLWMNTYEMAGGKNNGTSNQITVGKTFFFSKK